MGLKPVLGDIALASAVRTAATYVSGPVATAGQAAWVTMYVHASAISGSATLDASLEESADNSSWTAIPGSSITQLTAVGNRSVSVKVTKNYVRATTAVGATTSFTYEVRLDVLTV